PKTVTCPRCAAEGIPDGAPGCPRCGFTLDTAADQTNAGTWEPIPAELEQVLRRDLSSQYQITDLLGRGGMSFVYLAQEVELNRQVAIKVLPLQLLQGPGAAERFEREGRIAASLDHPHIVPIFRVGSTSTFLWYTMKRIRGKSLEQIIAERGGLPLAEVLSVVQQVGSALQYAHRHGVVHRDVKPGNVMIEDSGWVLVCDFGVARAFGSVSLTQTGASLGTPRYMAPEQFEGHPVDGRSDQYSLAILVWEALTGELPFGGDSLGELIRKHLLEPPPRLVEVLPDIPTRVSDAVCRAMSKKPAERFPDIAAFVNALGGEAMPRIPVAFPTLTVVPPPTPSPPGILWDAPTVHMAPRRRRQMVALSLVVGVALAGGVWAAFDPTGPANGATPDLTAEQDSTPVGTIAPPATDTLASRPEPPTSPPPPPPPPPPPAPPAAAAARAQLSLSTLPPGMLFLDGRRIRSTPIYQLEITPGPHRLQVKRDGFVPFDTAFTASPGQDVKWTRRALRPIGP
ncbi:MAG: serine/threonine-protein kinase, partial [Gemmatimonadales bacterium]